LQHTTEISVGIVSRNKTRNKMPARCSAKCFFFFMLNAWSW